ncbi:MAG: DUF2157 domain-containing protein [Coleofasciculaceae cyanobacterium SM2_3_26]|nr:DUF2157 domain-containing protein [Coleofasciculaceae cyanobacterium SM2_3_26]
MVTWHHALELSMRLPMPAEEFRRQLRMEARQWLEEGIVDSDQYAQLAQRYDWDALARPSRHRALGIFVGLGTVLLGVGIAALVLANWQAMSRSFKIFMLVCLLVGVNWVGFALWRWSQEHIHHREGWQTSLGQSLLVAGSLVLGMDMVLVGQLFHSRRSLAELFLIWGVGGFG